MNLYIWAEQHGLSSKLINAAMREAGLPQRFREDVSQEIYIIWLRKIAAAKFEHGQIAKYAYRIAFTAARKMRYAMANAVSLPDSAFRGAAVYTGSYSLQPEPESDSPEDNERWPLTDADRTAPWLIEKTGTASEFEVELIMRTCPWQKRTAR